MNKLRAVLIIFLFSISFSSFSNDKIRILASCVDYAESIREDRCDGYSFDTNDQFFSPVEIQLRPSESQHGFHIGSALVIPRTAGIPGFAQNPGHVSHCGKMFIKNDPDNLKVIPCIVSDTHGIHWGNRTPRPDISIKLKFDINKHHEIESSCTCVESKELR